ncbi:hypothetical protein [Streptomyces sp. NPDC051576]|uniref:hypothetical protein n=1 Tax=Streptomyces sp. NPDC051576 TaxID=3155803 RepID=UPI00343A5959
MNNSPTRPVATAAWLLVAVLFSLVVALLAMLLKVSDGQGMSLRAAVPTAAVAFAGTMALLVPTLSAVGLL